MASFHEYRRRSLVPLAVLGLAAYYFVVFAPLSRRAASLDEPLQQAWRKLATSLDQTNAIALDFQHITNQLGETRRDLSILDGAKKEAATRLELSTALRARLSTPFQLVDYQIERSKQIDELDKQAKQQQLAMDPAVFAGFPEHTADLQDPALLWVALSLTGDLLGTAARCKVAAVHFLEVALPLTNAPAAGAGTWAEIPLQIEFTASAENALKLVQSLPLRADEIKAAGLPPASTDKAPLLIDRLIIKKQSPEKLDEVRVWLLVVGFVYRE